MKYFSFLLLVMVLVLVLSCNKRAENLHDFNYPFIGTAGIQQAPNGTYQGMVTDKLDQANVYVTVEDGMITDIEIEDVVAFGWRQDAVLEAVPAQIIGSQSLDIDGVSGATGSVNGIKIAVSRAIESALAE